MNRQTYPVLCLHCGSVAREDGLIPGTHTICPACFAARRDEQSWDEAAKERQELIKDVKLRRPRISFWDGFWDGFLIGACFGALLFILIDWLIHFR